MNYLAQSYQYNYQYKASGGVAATWLVLAAAWAVLVLIGNWKVFTKAGQAGWKVLIPIYNAIIQLRIVGMSGWFVLLYIIPLVNVILAVIVTYKLAKSFGYGVGMTILLLLGIGYVILGFGSATYLGPDGPRPTMPATPAR